MMFGPKKVIIVAGVNKIVDNVDAGINRIRSMAAPMSAKKGSYFDALRGEWEMSRLRFARSSLFSFYDYRKAPQDD
jgi:hypothetical protein